MRNERFLTCGAPGQDRDNVSVGALMALHRCVFLLHTRAKSQAEQVPSDTYLAATTSDKPSNDLVSVDDNSGSITETVMRKTCILHTVRILFRLC